MRILLSFLVLMGLGCFLTSPAVVSAQPEKYLDYPTVEPGSMIDKTMSFNPSAIRSSHRELSSAETVFDFNPPMLSAGDETLQRRADSYELVLMADPVVDPTEIQQNQTFTVEIKFKNAGTGSFAGWISAAYFDGGGNFIDYVDIVGDINLGPGEGYITTALTLQSGVITAAQGDYSVFVYYSPEGSQNWTLISEGDYTNHAALTISGTAAYQLELVADLAIAPSTIEQNETFQTQTKFANTGDGVFEGSVSASIFDSGGNFVQHAATRDDLTLSPGEGYYSSPVVFYSSLITLDAGNYTIKITFLPAGATDWITMGGGSYSNQAILTLQQSSGYNLVLTDDLEISPTTIQQDEAFETFVKFKNIGGGSFNGSLCTAYFDADDNFVNYGEIKDNITIEANTGYSSPPLIFTSGQVKAEPADYTVRFFFKPTGQTDWTLVPAGGYISEATLTVESGDSAFLILYAPIVPSPSPVQKNQSLDVVVDFGNTGTLAFSGSYCVALFDSTLNFVEYIEIKDNMSLSPGNHYTNGLTFHSDGLDVPTGNYYLFAFHKPGGGNWMQTPRGSYDNPVSLSIVSTITDYTLSGYIKNSTATGINGVTVNFSNGGGSTVTDNTGFYTRKVTSGWSGTATPAMTGYTFNPASISFTNVTANMTNQNFTGTIQQKTISGYITDTGDAPVEGIVVSFTNNGGAAATNTQGFYSRSVPYSWSGVAAPGKTGFTFTPASRTYNNVIADQTGQNYEAASNITENIELTPTTLTFINPAKDFQSVQLFRKSDVLQRKENIHVQNLFIPNDDDPLILSEKSQTVLTQIQSDDATLSTRIVRVESERLLTDDIVRLNLFDGVDYEAIRTRLEKRSDNDFSWYAETEDESYAGIVFTVKDDRMAGKVQIGNQLYLITPLEDGWHVIVSRDPRQFPPDVEAITGTGDRKTSHTAYRSASEDAVISVLVAYTSAAANAAGDISSLIQLAIDETNQSYRNSDIPVRLQLVHTYQVSYTEVGTVKDLDRFTDENDGYMDEVHDLMDSYFADIAVLLLNKGSGYAGVGWINTDSVPEYGFAIVLQQYAAGYYTFAHEIGHVQGARHNPEQDPEVNPFAYGHGYVNEAEGWRTIMAYNSENCPDGYCERIPYWSSSTVFYEGNSTGDAATRDNARVLAETSKIIQDFRISETSRTVLIQNTGGGDLEITSISGNKTWLTISDHPSVPFTIAPGENQILKANVNWTEAGEDTQGMITIVSSDPDASTTTIQIELLTSPEITTPILTVMPSTQYIPSSSGTTNIIVENTGVGHMNWTSSADVPWISIIDGSSGTDYKIISMTYEENPGSGRIGEVTISAPGASPETSIVIVRQAGFGVICDFDGSGDIDIRDALIALKVLADKYNGLIGENTDINGDGAIGMDEALYILQKIASLR